MSQFDSNAYVGTESGKQAVVRLNNSFGAHQTEHSGTSRPAYAVANMIWLDTSGTPWLLKMFDGTDDITMGEINATTNEFNPYTGSTVYSAAAGGINNIVEDLTPQLGGTLDLNGNVITGLVVGTDVQAELTNAVDDLTTAEVAQLANIGTSAISSTEWGYLAGATAAFTSGLSSEIAANTAKATNVATDLTATAAPTTITINSSDGTNAAIASADATNAGVMTTGMYDEHVLNNAKATNATHTGDVTGSGALTIAADAVTASKLANSINTDIATGVTAGTTASAALPKAGGAMTGAITTNSTFDGVDIATRDAVLTSTATTAGAALPKAGGTMTGNIAMSGAQTVDGRDLSADGTKLDGIEASATADQTAAQIKTLLEDGIDSVHYMNGSIDTAHFAAGAVDAAAMGANSVDSSELVDGSVDLSHMSSESVDEDNLHISNSPTNGYMLTAESGNAGGLTWASPGSATIADDSVTLAKMASGVDGQIITYDADGDPVAVGPGTDGQVLTSQGAGLPAAFEDAGGGGGGGKMELISTTTISSDTDTIDFTGLTTYNRYEIRFDLNATNGARFKLLLSTDNGSTFATTGYDAVIVKDGASTSTTNTTAPYADISGSLVNTRSGVIRLQNMKTTTAATMSWEVFNTNPGSSHNYVHGAERFAGQTADVDAVRLYSDFRDWNTGTVSLYGIGE